MRLTISRLFSAVMPVNQTLDTLVVTLGPLLPSRYGHDVIDWIVTVSPTQTKDIDNKSISALQSVWSAPTGYASQPYYHPLGTTDHGNALRTICSVFNYDANDNSRTSPQNSTPVYA